MNKKVDEGQPVNGQKNPDAVALGKLGGLKGGNARAAKLSGEERSQIAKQGAAARWDKTKDNQPKTNPAMNEQIEKDRKFNELRRQYLTREITLEALLKQIPETGEVLLILMRDDGTFACLTGKWARYTNNDDASGCDLHTWIPARYWKPSLRQAIVYTLNKLHKEKNNLLFEDSDGEDLGA